jgi:hypothetical protein
MSTFPDLARAAVLAACAAAIGLLPACGGHDDAVPVAGTSPASQDLRVEGRDAALRLLARGALAPIHYSELAHAVLARAFESRSVAGGFDPVEGTVDVDIQASDNAEALMLRGAAGFVRAVVRFEGVVFAGATIDGTVTLDVSRAAAGAGSQRRCQADSLSVADGRGVRHWSHLDIAVDAEQVVQRMSVVSDVTVDPEAPLWFDVVSSTPGRLDATPAGATLSSGRLVATGIIGFVNARLTLQVGADRGWTIEVDNDKDEQVDFVVRASAAEVRALTASP